MVFSLNYSVCFALQRYIFFPKTQMFFAATKNSEGGHLWPPPQKTF